LPELIAIYENHTEHRDRFEIIAIHDKRVQSFAELDEKLVKIKVRYWQGTDLPFPVLLDTAGKTEELYSIRAWPTGLLIDPEGKLVGQAQPSDLEARLPPLSLAKRWARHRNTRTIEFWSFEPARFTLRELASFLEKQTDCPFELDPTAIAASGLTSHGPHPGVVMGRAITLRSIEDLLLAPHGLGIAPALDGKKLLITKRSSAAEAESFHQKQRAKELAERLDGGSIAEYGTVGKHVAIEINDAPLLEAIRLISSRFSLPVALDARAMHAKTLDPNARVTGRINPGDARNSLTKMLDPLGLKVEIRHEVVLVTNKTK
jgi:hypothetical protein